MNKYNFHFSIGFAVSDLPKAQQNSIKNITECVYYGYRYPPDHPKKYRKTDSYFLVHTWKFTFVIIFEVFVFDRILFFPIAQIFISECDSHDHRWNLLFCR